MASRKHIGLTTEEARRRLSVDGANGLPAHGRRDLKRIILDVVGEPMFALLLIAALHHAGIERAKLILCTIPDDLLRGVTNAKLVRAVRHINPEATIIANAIELKDAQAIYDAGADYVYLGRTEISNGIVEIIGKSIAGDLSAYRAAQQTAIAQRREVFD